MHLIKPKTITVVDGDGDEHSVVISRFPAVQGLEINARYPASMVMNSVLPKFSDYTICEELMFKIFQFVAVEKGGVTIRMTTEALINNHMADWEVMVRVIWAIMEYNNSFFRNGTISDFFASVVQQVLAKISEISTRSSEPSSTQTKPPFTS